MGRVFANGPGDLGSIPGRVIPKTIKMILDTSLLSNMRYISSILLSNMRYISRVKWSNPRKGVAPSSTPLCSSYWKRSLLVALDYGRQLYLLYLLCSAADAVSSGSWFIVFKVLTLNVAMIMFFLSQLQLCTLNIYAHTCTYVHSLAISTLLNFFLMEPNKELKKNKLWSES